MQSPYTFIFVGRSGSGKGTQLELLKKYLTEKHPEQEFKSIIMGEIYRAFFSEKGYVQEIANDITTKQGKFQPDFLTNSLFVYKGIHSVDGTSNLFIDGYPRTVGQFQTLKDLFEYIKMTNPVFINVVVSADSVRNRMRARGRNDDSDLAIESRLGEYERAIVPMLEVVKKDSSVKYIEVDGEPAPEEIHKDIIAKLGLS